MSGQCFSRELLYLAARDTHFNVLSTTHRLQHFPTTRTGLSPSPCTYIYLFILPPKARLPVKITCRNNRETSSERFYHLKLPRGKPCGHNTRHNLPTRRIKPTSWSLLDNLSLRSMRNFRRIRQNW